MRVGAGLVFCFAVLAACRPGPTTAPAESMTWVSDPSLPDWVTKVMVDHRDARSWGSVEQATYRGDSVFLVHGEREDQTLFAENGVEICRFGGLAGIVMAGDCDIGQIRYVRTLYQRARR